MIADAEAIVNTVNCEGIMGAGLALQFKKIYPDNFMSYSTACRANQVLPGKMFIYKLAALTNPKYIINFPTKRLWRNSSWMGDIEAGLLDLVNEVKKRNIKSIAIPPLGCGMGRLNWHDVHNKIVQAFEIRDSELQIIIFQP